MNLTHLNEGPKDFIKGDKRIGTCKEQKQK